MKFYLINLDRSPDRLSWIQRQTTQLGIEVTRISAIDGSKLAEDVVLQWTRAVHPLFGIGPNEIACFLSHREAWKRIATGSDPWGFVAEDDIHISSSLPEFLESHQWIPADADLVKAETVNKRVWLSRKNMTSHAEHQVCELRSLHLGAAGVFFSKQCAQKLVDATVNLCASPDQIVFNQSLPPARPLKIYQILPALVVQDWALDQKSNQTQFASLLLQERNAYHVSKHNHHQSLAEYAWHKLSSPVRKVSRRSLEAAASLLGTHRVIKIDFDTTRDSSAAWINQ